MVSLENSEKHEQFWLDDGNMILLVDGIYFNVHRAMLAQSCGLIKDMLALSAEGKTPQTEGGSVEHPVPIQNVAFHDFEVVLRDAYGRQPLINFTPNAENMIRLSRAAHRLQAWPVLIAAATEAMKIIPATERLVLHHELNLESIQALQMEEINRQYRVSNARAVARGLPEREFTPPAPPDANWNYETVFFEVAKTAKLALPVAGLDDKINLQLALARAELLETRRERLSAYFEASRDYYRLEAYIAVAGLDICSETVDAWRAARDKKGCVQGTSLSAMRGHLRTEAQDRAVVQKFCSQSRS